MKMYIRIRDLFILFIIFAVCGWIYEVVLTELTYGYFENRGFLHGPWLPIYGFGGLAVYLIFGRLLKKPGKLWEKILRGMIVFVCICLIAAAFELAVSYLLDAVGIGFASLWDYYGRPMNFEGRICPEASLRFGAIGLAALYFVVPLYERLIRAKKQNVINVIAAVIGVLFIADAVSRFVSFAV